MTPGAWPREDALGERLLRVSPADGRLTDARLRDLPSMLGPGDLLVVNDAATLPASLRAETRAGTVEVRLAAPGGPGETWRAVLFGDGDWRTDTERRGAPPRLAAGDVLRFHYERSEPRAAGSGLRFHYERSEPRAAGSGLRSGEALGAVVESVSEISPRLVEIAFDRDAPSLWREIYRLGRPVQYRYVARPLDLWHVQTSYGARPWAVEMPSAGRPLRWELLLALRARGVEIARVTHAAGLSSTGDPALDAALPLPERYDIPASTVDAVTRAERVIAAGTTVVRALEGCVAERGRLLAGPGETALRVTRAHALGVVDGLLTGMHEPAASHFELLEAFAPRALLHAAWEHAEGEGYLCHEFGDSTLIL